MAAFGGLKRLLPRAWRGPDTVHADAAAAWQLVPACAAVAAPARPARSAMRRLMLAAVAFELVLASGGVVALAATKTGGDILAAATEFICGHRTAP